MLTAYNRFYTHVKVNAQTNHHQTNEQTNKQVCGKNCMWKSAVKY